MSNDSKLKTQLTVDEPVAITASLRTEPEDRRYIDNQILAAETHLVSSVISGVQTTWFHLWVESDAVSIGDVLCPANVEPIDGIPVVTRATPDALAAGKCVSGVAVSSALPNTRVNAAVGGIISSEVSDLGPGVLAGVRVSNGRCQRVASFAGSDYPVGVADPTGNVTIIPLPTGSVLGAGGGGGGGNFDVDTATGNYTVVTSNNLFLKVASLGSPATIEMPAAPPAGQLIIVKRNSNDATALTISGNGGTIDGAATKTFGSGFAGVIYQTDGTNWFQVSQFDPVPSGAAIGLPITDAAWYLNGSTGNDSNSGTSAGSPLRTWEGLQAKWTYGGKLQQATTVTLQTSMPAANLIVDMNGFDLSIVGTVTAQRSGTITALTARNRAFNTRSQITDSALPLANSWTADIDKRVQFTSGPAANAFTWVSADNGGKTATIYEPGLIDGDTVSQVDPAVGNSYAVQTLSQVPSFDFSKVTGTTSGVLRFFDIQFTDATYISSTVLCEFNGCRFDTQLFSSAIGGACQFNACHFTCDTYIGSGFVRVDAGGIGDGSLFIYPGADADIDNDFIIDRGGSLLIAANGSVNAAGFAVFNASVRAENPGGNGINVGPGNEGLGFTGAGATLTVAGLSYGVTPYLWGSGNAGAGLAAQPQSNVFIESGGASITGSGGDFTLGGTGSNSRPFSESTGTFLPPLASTWALLTTAQPTGFGNAAYNVSKHSSIVYGRTTSSAASLTNGDVLTVVSGKPAWTAPVTSGGTVTNVSGTSPISVATGSTTPVISHQTSGVTAAAYANPASVTVNSTGHVTAITAGSPPLTDLIPGAGLSSTGGTTPTVAHVTSGVTAAAYANPASVTVNNLGHVTAISAGSAPVTSITGTSPIVVSGTTTPTISHATSGVAAGTYSLATVSVDARGHVTNIGNGTAVTSVTAGTGVTFSGPSTSPTISLSTTGVTANGYITPDVTIDAQGRITSASNGSRLRGGSFRVAGTADVEALVETLNATGSCTRAFVNTVTDAGYKIDDNNTSGATGATTVYRSQSCTGGGTSNGGDTWLGGDMGANTYGNVVSKGPMAWGVFYQTMPNADVSVSAADSAKNIVHVTGTPSATRGLTFARKPTDGGAQFIKNSIVDQSIAVKWTTAAGASTNSITVGPGEAWLIHGNAAGTGIDGIRLV